VGNEPTPDSLAAYRKRFGADYYSFDAGAMRGIVLNSSLISAPGKAQEDNRAQERWLRQELERAQSEHVKHIVIFQHHPYFTKTADEPDGYFNIPLASAKDLSRAISKIRSHLHHCRPPAPECAGAGRRYANDHHRSFRHAPGGARSGMRVVTVGDGVRHEFYELSVLPNRIGPF
jgi:hypothetical protein